MLILTAEHKNGQIYSGRIHSKGKMSFKHRKVEACIRLPKTANGLWPAAMMGDNEKPWPQCGEIDIMEMGEKNGIINGTSETSSEYRHSLRIPSCENSSSGILCSNVAHSLQDGTSSLYVGMD